MCHHWVVRFTTDSYCYWDSVIYNDSSNNCSFVLCYNPDGVQGLQHVIQAFSRICKRTLHIVSLQVSRLQVWVCPLLAVIKHSSLQIHFLCFLRFYCHWGWNSLWRNIKTIDKPQIRFRFFKASTKRLYHW